MIFLLACGGADPAGSTGSRPQGSKPSTPTTPGSEAPDTPIEQPTLPTGVVLPSGDEPDVFQDGSSAAPFLISTKHLPHAFVDRRDTRTGASAIASYPPNTQDESGPEIYYAIDVTEPVYFSASLVTPEPSGTDVDLHLVSSLDPITLARGNARVHATLLPGRYYLIADSYEGRAGVYTVNAMITATAYDPSLYFNAYILRAVESLYADYRLLGYDAAVLTHDIDYGGLGTVTRSGDGHTMCVAATMEVMLTAMQLYAADTRDQRVWTHLPVDSWKRLRSDAIRAHIWVNDKLTSSGAPDALRHFGMGQNVPFEQLKPGSFIGVNRTTGTGHAVVFLAFIDSAGNEYTEYNNDVIGFKYFSAQGGFAVGSGGLDYRYAIFEGNGTPTMPGKRDFHIIRSSDQHLFNTGMMFHPDVWQRTSFIAGVDAGETTSSLDSERFNGDTGD